MLRRIGSSVLVLFVVLSLNFVLFRVVPGDPTTTIIDPSFSPEAKAELASLWGLDKPVGEQFLIYVKRMLSFELGDSFLTGRPVWEEISSRLPATVSLLGSAMLISTLLGIWLGVKASLHRGGVVEKVVMASSAISSSFPSFFVQMVLLMVFGAMWQVFPLRGSVSIPPPEGGWALFVDKVWHLALPVLSLAMLSFGGWALYVRNLMVKALGEDYVTMARARGLSRKRVVWNHAFRSVLPPILTILLLSVPGIVSGAVITETVFSLHGVGRFLLDSISGQDYPASEGAFFLLGVLTVGCNLLADVLYGVVDPRVRRRGA